MPLDIRVYGADWCDDTELTRQHLDELGIPYRYINLDNDDAAALKVREWNGGKRITPTVVISSDSGTDRIAEPSNTELDDLLGQHGSTSAA